MFIFVAERGSRGCFNARRAAQYYADLDRRTASQKNVVSTTNHTNATVYKPRALRINCRLVDTGIILNV